LSGSSGMWKWWRSNVRDETEYADVIRVSGMEACS
jgi:hypothetical protein